MQTYWAALGLAGTPASSAVEEAAKLVQWASYALQQGASANEAKIRYNLDAFWKAKAAAYGSQTPEGKTQLEKLDAMAHGIWNALESGKIYSASPGYLDFYLKNVITGGTPARPEADAAAQRARAAATAAAAASVRASQPALANYYSRTAAAVPQHQKAAAGLWEQTGKEWLGIPVWAWLVGGGILAASLLLRD
jgi:hypothetical protein